MYLVRTKNKDVICNTAEEVKEIDKAKVISLFSLSKVDYDSIISTGVVRDCIYKYLKGDQKDKYDVIDYVSEMLDVKKIAVSKVITAMKREKIVYDVIDMGNYIGID